MSNKDYFIETFTNVLVDEPMKNHCTFRVGGNADFVISPENTEELKKLLSYLKNKKMPYYVIGNGSNLLVNDKGFKGVIIKTNKMKSIDIDDNIISVSCGNILKEVCIKAYENSLSGMEFAYGIPGTIGGAVYMNAGAYGGEMVDVLMEADILNENNEIVTMTKEELALSYRKSVLQSNNMILLNCKIQLNKGDKKDIKLLMDENLNKRNTKQPINKPSAGSTFKRPEGYYAGKLIMDSGLRGYKIGGAQVSDKHCGFIINNDNATTTDVLNLIDYVQSEVYKQFNVKLEKEVRIIGG